MLITSINTLFVIIDKENTTINSPNEINAQLYNNYICLNILFTNIRSISNHKLIYKNSFNLIQYV